MQLFYREKGSDALPPLFIFHGLWGASDNWLPIAERLSAHFHVILPDMRNHGHSPHESAMDYPSMAADVRQLISFLHLREKPLAVGHSMGGKCLMYLLLNTPDLFRGSAVVDIVPKSYPLNDFCGWHRQLLDFFLHFPIETMQSRTSLHAAVRQSLPDEQMYQVVLKNVIKTSGGFQWKVNVDAIRHHFIDIMQWPLVPRVSENSVLFVRGEKSEHFSMDDYASVQAIFPNAQFKTIPEAGHWIHAQKPRELSDVLIDYFIGCPVFVPKLECQCRRNCRKSLLIGLYFHSSPCPAVPAAEHCLYIL